MQRFAVIFIRISVATLMVVTLCAAGLVLFARSQSLHILSVQTGSMSPAIRPGSAVLLRQYSGDTRTLKSGDVISYRSLEDNNVIITHRIISIDLQRGLITTKGDSNKIPDTSFLASRIIGVVAHPVPYAGSMLDFFRHPLGLILAVYLPGLALIGWEIKRLMHYYERQRYVLYYY